MADWIPVELLQPGDPPVVFQFTGCFADDIANPKSPDPVERFSSRIAGAQVAGAQTTMNPFVIKERIGENTFGNPMPYKPFGAETAEEMITNWDKYKELAQLCSPITHLTKDDPPLHLSTM